MADEASAACRDPRLSQEMSTQVSKVRQLSRVGVFIREIGVEDERSTRFQLPIISRKMSTYELHP